MNLGEAHDTSHRKWFVCGMLLLALVLNYMDRQTLSLTITTIEKEYSLSATQYGQLEKGFGYAFAIGGLVWGFLADRISVRWLYPFVLLGWSAAGLATGYADRIGSSLAVLLDNQDVLASTNPDNARAYIGFWACRVILGFFEAGQWPCALVTTQRLLSQADRPLGNSILQSGASIGAILTPIVVGLVDNGQPGWWRSPYVVIGCLGLLWVIPWHWIVWGMDLSRPKEAEQPKGSATLEPMVSPKGAIPWLLVRRFAALIVVVIVINMTWQFFRVWLPKMLEQYHGYSKGEVRWFVTSYYIATDIGCLSAGAAVKYLASRRWDVHRARLSVYSFCALLTALSTVAAMLPKGPLLLFLFLIIGFGALGLFPIYYSFTQELSTRHQGKVTGTTGFITWVVTSEMQQIVGAHVDATHSYRGAIFLLGLAPLLGAIAVALLWGKSPEKVRAIA